jgi:hypothetical protein
MRHWVGVALGLLLRCAGTLLLIAAGTPPDAPFLRIEAGAHTGAIAHLAIDATGRLLATASYDKTVRLWSLPDGAPRGVLRPPIGSGQEGEIYAVAVTPDGTHVFAAGATGGEWDGTYNIYRFDVGRLVMDRMLSGLQAPINDLAISPDGALLAVGLAQSGIHVYDARTGVHLFDDAAYAGPVRSVLFDRAGRLFTAAGDNKIRLYDRSGRKLVEMPSRRPWGLALSPDDGLLAVTAEVPDAGHLRIDVVSARTLASVFSPNTTGLAGEGLLSAAWVSDDAGGVQLLAGGYARDGGGMVIRRWGDFGLGASTDLAAGRDTIRHILRLPGGGAVYASEDPGWGRIGPNGRVVRRPEPKLADLRPARGRLGVSADGAVVEFATATGLQRFAVTERRLTTTKLPDAALTRARTDIGDKLVAWQDSNAPLLNGTRLPLGRNELSRAAAMLPDGGVLLGTDNHLRLFGPDGRERAAVEVTTPIAAVTVVPGLVVAALLDGTIRWYGLEPGTMLRERLALFAPDDGAAEVPRWVLFTPDGFFDHAERGGNELVGVHLNRARNQQPDWISFSQAYRVLYAPAIVRAALRGDETPARARLSELGDIRARFARQPTAEVTAACIPSPTGACTALATTGGRPVNLAGEAERVRLSVTVTERGLGLGPLDVFVNERNAGRWAPVAGVPTEIEVPLDAGGNIVQLRAYDAGGTIFTSGPPLELTRAVAAVAGRGRLFVLAVGVDDFANPALKLNFAAADARSFAQQAATAAAPLYGGVSVTLLLNEQATRAGILGAFDRLAGEIRPRDTFLFYVATHGVLDEDTDRFLLVPQDLADISSWASMARASIDEPTLIAALSRIQARDALLFLDTCHSGKITADALANMGHETGRYLLTASTSVQEALDSYDDRNGVFVHAVAEALSGRAGQDSDGNLGALSLGEYVSRRVGELAREKGHDQDALFRTAQRDLRSFPVARVRP